MHTNMMNIRKYNIIIWRSLLQFMSDASFSALKISNPMSFTNEITFSIWSRWLRSSKFAVQDNFSVFNPILRALLINAFYLYISYSALDNTFTGLAFLIKPLGDDPSTCIVSNSISQLTFRSFLLPSSSSSEDESPKLSSFIPSLSFY